jgi:hypothetical protein
LKEIELIKQRNERDGRFIPILEEAKEKNRIMMLMNYKDHINKVLGNRIMNHRRKCMKENLNGKKRLKRLIREANRQRKEILYEQQEFQEIFGLYGQEAYLQNEEDPIKVMDAIFETWEDIGKPGMKYFQKNMISEIETSFTYQLIEEIVTGLEREIEDESSNREQVELKRMELLYDYYCWNLKLISTREFYENIKRYEEIVYDTGFIQGKRKVTEKIKIMLDIEKPEHYFEELDPKFSIFTDKRKRQLYKGEEIHDAHDDIVGNPEIISPDEKWLRERWREGDDGPLNSVFGATRV